MDTSGRILFGITLFVLGVTAASFAIAEPSGGHAAASGHARDGVQLGPRPFYLVKGMDEGALKSKLLQCQSGPFYRTDFSIAHRGAPLQFPEHTRESYEAGAKHGRGHRRVRRHLHEGRRSSCAATMNAICTRPPTSSRPSSTTPAPSRMPVRAPRLAAARATSRLPSSARSPARWMRAIRGRRMPRNFSVVRQAGVPICTLGRGTLLTLRESIALNRRLGVKHTPELKSGQSRAHRAGVWQPGGLCAGDDRRVQACRCVNRATSGRSRSISPTCSTGSSTSHASADRRSTWTTSIRP